MPGDARHAKAACVAGSCRSVRWISAASAGVTRSSASSDRIQSWLASEAAKFFCADVAGPLADDHAIGVPPRDGHRVVGALRIDDDHSSAQDTDASASPMSAASFLVMTVTETFGTRGV